LSGNFQKLLAASAIGMEIAKDSAKVMLLGLAEVKQFGSEMKSLRSRISFNERCTKVFI
jgi:hypothetical protein